MAAQVAIATSSANRCGTELVGDWGRNALQCIDDAGLIESYR